MMTPAELTQVPEEVTPESIHAFNRDAATMVDDMIKHVSSIREQLEGAPGAKAERSRKDTDRLLNSLHASRPGVVDLSSFLQKQPAATDFRFPARADALAAEARRRLEKSKYMFPEPKAVIDAAAVLWGDDAAGCSELRVRLAYYLSKMNIVQDGLGVSAACRRLMQAAACTRSGMVLTQEQTDLLAAAKASLMSFMYEARKHGGR
jgi:hypothetical protein